MTRKITKELHESYEDKCRSARENIVWDTSAPFLPNLTLKEALHMAKNGENLNRRNAEMLEPATRDHNEWMDYAHILTIEYNKNRTERKYTILRTGWLN